MSFICNNLFKSCFAGQIEVDAPRKEKAPVEESFADKVVRIVKEQGKAGAEQQMQSSLTSLNAKLTQAIAPEEVAEIVRRVKLEAPSNAMVLPALLSSLREASIVGLSLWDAPKVLIGSLVDLSSFDQAVRFACAKKDKAMHASKFCENLKANKYGKLSLEQRKELAKSLRPDFLIEVIDIFDLDVDTKKEIAMSLVKEAYLSMYIHNFMFDDATLLSIASTVIENGQTGRLAEYVQSYGASNTKKIAEMLLEKHPVALFIYLDQFNLTDESFITLIAQKALKKDPSLAEKVPSLHLQERKHILALMTSVCHTPEHLRHFAFFIETQENRKAILLECPELAYWTFQDHPEELCQLICYYHSPIPSSLFGPYVALYEKMQSEQDADKKIEMTRHFVLKSIALTQAKQSPAWASALSSLIDDLQKPIPKKDNPRVREQKNQWLADFLMQARVRNVPSELLLKHMGLIKAVLDLKTPFLRTCLQDNLMQFFTHPDALENYAVCQSVLMTLAKNSNKKMKEEDQRKLAFKREEKLSVLLMMLSPYFSTASMASSAFLVRTLKLLYRNKNFEDGVRMKTLLSKIQILLAEPRLTDQDKVRILERVIFVEDRSKNVKQQADEIIGSASLVMQYLEFDKIKLLKTVRTPHELRANIKAMFVEQLGFEALGPEFDAQYATAFETSKKTSALLTYAAHMKRRPKEETDDVLKSIRAFTKSLLTKSFDKLRNSKENSEHISALERVAPGALAEFQKEFTLGPVKLTSDPWLLFFAGKDTETCQSFDSADTQWSRGMIGSVVKGEVQQMVVTKKVVNKEGEEEEVVAAKRSIRLLLDKDTQKPVLYQGDTLPWDMEGNIHAQDFDAACKALSDKLSRKLGYPVPLLGRAGSKPYGGTIACLPCKDVAFEYVEGADQELPGHSVVVAEKGYTISKANIIYDPAAK